MSPLVAPLSTAEKESGRLALEDLQTAVVVFQRQSVLLQCLVGPPWGVHALRRAELAMALTTLTTHAWLMLHFKTGYGSPRRGSRWRVNLARISQAVPQPS